MLLKKYFSNVWQKEIPNCRMACFRFLKPVSGNGF